MECLLLYFTTLTQKCKYKDCIPPSKNFLFPSPLPGLLQQKTAKTIESSGSGGFSSGPGGN